MENSNPTSVFSVRTLSCFLGFRCRSNTHCCRDQWALPLPKPEADKIGAAILKKYGAKGVLAYLSGYTVAQNQSESNAPARIRVKDNGQCAFLMDHNHLCLLQSEFGADFLPSACKTFPRACVSTYGHDYYTLSTQCPTVWHLLDQDIDVRCCEDVGYAPECYPCVSVFSDRDHLVVGNTVLTLHAYFKLKEYLVSLFNRRDFPDIGSLLVWVCLLLSKWTTQAAPAKWFEPDMKAFIENEEQMDSTEMLRLVAQVPGNLSQMLVLVGSWARLRQSVAPPASELMTVVTKKYAPQNFDAPFLNIFREHYGRFVAPLFASQAHIVRNYLASKLVYDPYVVANDCFLLLFGNLYFCYTLLCTFLTEKSLAGQPLEKGDLFDAMSQVDINTMHHGGVERKLAEVFGSSAMTTRSFLNVIKM